MDTDRQALMDSAEKLGKISADNARDLVNSLYRDGEISRHEAELLFDLNDKLNETDRHWDERFVEAIMDHVLSGDPPEQFITVAEADWLIDQVTRDGVVRVDTEMKLLISVLRRAYNAPEKLGKFTLNAVCERIKSAGKASAADTEFMRYALYAGAGSGGIWVSRWEATRLFETNDAVAFAKNDPAWNDLFSRAIANHLLARAHPEPLGESELLAREAWFADTKPDVGGIFARIGSDFGKEGWFERLFYNSDKAAKARMAANEAADRVAAEINEDETGWFLKRLGWDKKVSPAERALIDFLKEEAPGFAAGIAEAA